LDDIIQEDYYSVIDNNKMNDNDHDVLDRPHTLDEKLLPLSSSSSLSSTSSSSATLFNNSKFINILRKKNKSKYQKILSSLYWQQWLMRKKNQKSTSNIIENWKNYSLLYKINIIITYPMVLCRDLTIPSVNKENWSKYYAIIQMFLSPLLVLFIINLLNYQIFNISLWLYSLCLSMLPSIYIYFYTNHSYLSLNNNNNFLILWIILSFLMCILWIYLLAKELITCLSALGNILSISPAFLGLTILAWCNSIGDLFINISVAIQGLGDMAVAGCYGGPVFDILIGLGTALTYATIQSYPQSYHIQLDLSCYLSILFIFISLLSTLLIVSINQYKIDKFLGYYLLFLYSIYSICQILLLILH